MSFVWHVFAIITFLLVQIWLMKYIYFFMKKCSPQFDDLLLSEELQRELCFTNGNGNISNKFKSLVSENESDNEKENFNSLKLKVKNENTSSGNSSISGHSSGNKSPV